MIPDVRSRWDNPAVFDHLGDPRVLFLSRFILHNPRGHLAWQWPCSRHGYVALEALWVFLGVLVVDLGAIELEEELGDLVCCVFRFVELEQVR